MPLHSVTGKGRRLFSLHMKELKIAILIKNPRIAILNLMNETKFSGQKNHAIRELDTGLSFAVEKHISLPIREKKTGLTELHTLYDPRGDWSPWVSDLRTITYPHKKTSRMVWNQEGCCRINQPFYKPGPNDSDFFDYTTYSIHFFISRFQGRKPGSGRTF